MKTKPKTKLAQNLEQCLLVEQEFAKYGEMASHLIKCYNEDSLNTIRFFNTANYMDTYLSLGQISIHVETVPRPRKVGDKVVSNDIVVTHMSDESAGISLSAKLSDLEKLFRHEKNEVKSSEDILKFLTFANYVHTARNIENEAVRRFFLDEHKL